MNEPTVIQEMLAAKTLAVVGLSDRSDRPSHYVSAYMQQHGRKLYPVNPQLELVLGEPSYPSLSAVVERTGVLPEVVNVFRLPALIPGIVEEMIALGLKKIWVQQGIVNLEAAATAERHGIGVVMDRCIMVEHRHADAW